MFDWNTILYPVIIALITALVSLITVGINKITAYLKTKTTNDNVIKYIGIAEKIVENSVATVANSYVDNLKKDGMFDKAAQLEALKKAVELTKSQLTKDTFNALSQITTDVDGWIASKIEKDIVDNKKS